MYQFLSLGILTSVDPPKKLGHLKTISTEQNYDVKDLL